MKIEGDTLTLRVKLSERQGPSKSGKTVIVASTDGIVKVKTPAGEVGIGLNVFVSQGGRA